MCISTRLPIDLNCHIASFLSARDLAHLAGVNKINQISVQFLELAEELRVTRSTLQCVLEPQTVDWDNNPPSDDWDDVQFNS